MPEDAGKKRYIRNFLEQINQGEGYVGDIWIERDLRLPGKEGEGYTTAKSLSGNSSISNITELLLDDLKRTFDDRYFTFRFVAALLGSGKTSLLTYLHELTIIQSNYEEHSVVIQFPLDDLLLFGSSHSFSIKFYCYILGDTFWQLIHNQKLLPEVKEVAKDILKEYLDEQQLLDQLIRSDLKPNPFRKKFSNFFATSGINFAELFFDVIFQVTKLDSRFTFVYLIDQLDGLEKFPQEIEETRVIFRSLLKQAAQKFGRSIPLLIYLVGTSDNVSSLIEGDPVLKSLVKKSVINLSSGSNKEFMMIKQEIDERIKGAYKGYKNFNSAWQEIENIPFNPAKNFREFFQDYAGKFLEIHERYFSEAEEQKFEGNARQLVKAECQKRWGKYLKQKAYTLSAVETTKELQGKKGQKYHLDCYVELLDNKRPIARAFGEAKNYKLIIEHLDDFSSWLKDLGFKSYCSENTPPDLAFMIAPSCPERLKRKLELENIEFIQADKETPTLPPEPSPTHGINTNISGEKEALPPLPTPTPAPEINIKISGEKEPPRPTPKVSKTGININTANESELRTAFRGSGVKKTTIQKLIKNRKGNPYQDLAHLVSDLKFTNNVKVKLQEKLHKGEISFYD